MGGFTRRDPRATLAPDLVERDSTAPTPNRLWVTDLTSSRRYFVGAVLGTSAGLTVAASYDWPDDASGLFVIGVGMVMMGSLAVTTALSAVTVALTRQGPAAVATQ